MQGMRDEYIMTLKNKNRMLGALGVETGASEAVEPHPDVELYCCLVAVVISIMIIDREVSTRVRT